MSRLHIPWAHVDNVSIYNISISPAREDVADDNLNSPKQRKPSRDCCLNPPPPKRNQRRRDCTSLPQLGLSKSPSGFYLRLACLITLIGRCLRRSRGEGDPHSWRVSRGTDALCKKRTVLCSRCSFLPTASSAARPHISVAQHPREFSFLRHFSPSD